MFFKQLKKLKAFDINQEISERLDGALHYLSDEGAKRFTPKLVSEKIDISLEETRTLLLRASQLGVLEPFFEIECPEGDSDFFVKSLEEINWGKEVQCRVCDSIYIPSSEHVWLTFSLKGEFSDPKVLCRP